MMTKVIVQNDYTSLIALEAMVNDGMKTIRGKRVMLHSDIAKLYSVSPEYLRKQVIKNITRFPEDFMIELTPDELSLQKAEIFPFAYSESGILMAGGLLKGRQAIKIHLQLMSYFVQLFNQVLSDSSLSEKLENHTKDEEIFVLLKKMLKRQNL